MSVAGVFRERTGTFFFLPSILRRSPRVLQRRVQRKAGVVQPLECSSEMEGNRGTCLTYGVRATDSVVCDFVRFELNVIVYLWY